MDRLQYYGEFGGHRSKMAILNILHYPDPRLRIKAKVVDQVDNKTRKQVDDMLETMYEAPGIGLAAPQVNISKRIVVIDVSEDKSSPLVLINPEIIDSYGSTKSQEGCLSVPGIYEDVVRADGITIKALDREGNHFEFKADDLLSVCIQHELDHLQGKLFVDYLSSLKQQRIRKKLEKANKVG